MLGSMTAGAASTPRIVFVIEGGRSRHDLLALRCFGPEVPWAYGAWSLAGELDCDSEEVVGGVARLYPARYPGLTLAGYRNGYWKPDEEEQVVAQIAAARPDILFVAISSPKKEAFLARYQAAMKVPFAMGVGGTFDVAVGLVKRAPVWMQNAGLEWFYRFLQEPRRMFKRYLVGNTRFLVACLRELRRPAPVGDSAR
mgnify:CR=1 FL=1